MGFPFDEFERVICKPYSFSNNQEVGHFLYYTIRNLRQCVNDGLPIDIAFDNILLALEKRAKDLSNK